MPIKQRTKFVAIYVVCHCNRLVLLQSFKNCVAISWHYCHGTFELQLLGVIATILDLVAFACNYFHGYYGMQ